MILSSLSRSQHNFVVKQALGQFSTIGMKLMIAPICAIATVATALTGKSDPDDCVVSSGSYGNVAYRYFSRGANCATRSEIGAIEGVLHHLFDRLDPDEIPESRCIKWDEDGTRDGWLLYGIAGKVDLTGYCGPRLGSKPQPGSHVEL